MKFHQDVRISRRTLIAAAASAGLIGSGFARSGYAATKSGLKSASGLISVFKLGPITLHSYMAPSASAAVTTQIIETPNELHIIDTQFLQNIAKEARSYVDSLAKPISGVYLSHWHPDHLLGASQFANLPFVTTKDIHADCEKYRDTFLKRKEQFGDETPLVLPEGTLTSGEHEWDGVNVVINQINDCESEHTLTFHIPEAGLMIVQDLMFNNAHAFPLGNHDNWIKELRKIRDVEGLRLLGCGHGLPATSGAVTDSIAYLEFQKTIFGIEKDAESAINSLKSKYPGFEGQSSLRFIENLYK